MEIPFIRIAHESGLGCGKIEDLDVLGEDIKKINWNFNVGNTFASKGQKLIYWGPLKPLEKILLRSWLTPLAYIASNLYHNQYWLNMIGKKRISKAMQTKWGELFNKY